MQKTILTAAILLIVSVGILYAHPASNVAAGFNKDENLLTVTWKHQVKNNADHFIQDVVVRKNGTVIITQKLGAQDSMDGGSLTYKINELKPKDKLQISTKCNKGGLKSVTIENK